MQREFTWLRLHRPAQTNLPQYFLGTTDRMNSFSPRHAFLQHQDQRAQPRFTVALPALALFGSRRLLISIVNIATDGAMIESGAVLPNHARLAISCGTVNVTATIVWQGADGQFGLRFNRSLTDRDVNEQIGRSAALNSRRERQVLNGLGTIHAYQKPV